MTGPLDTLVAGAAWEPDWQDVLDRADVASDRPHRLRGGRRALIAVAILVAILVPLGAFAASSDWWFLGSDIPTPLSDPIVVERGVWDGQPWKLVAYPAAKGLCVSLTPDRGSAGAVLGCAPIQGAPRTDKTAGPDLGLTYITGGGGDFPSFIAGPVMSQATTVEVRFQTGERLRLPTVGGAPSLGDVRFYAAELPSSLNSPVVALSGLDQDGDIVACLTPSDPTSSSLDGCR